MNEASDSPMRSFKFDGGVDMVDKTARITNLENFFGISASVVSTFLGLRTEAISCKFSQQSEV